MLYGANGYTGRIVAELAAERGERPVLAGRREGPVRELADKLGFEHRVFPLDAEAALVADMLAPVSAVLHCAGPFSATSRPMIDACLASKTHYLDITGEIAVFEACHDRDAEAVAAGVTVMPGVGFDVVPSDCLAASLKAALPDATHLELAFAGGRPSQGTMKSMVEGIPQGGAVREDGEITRVPAAYRTREIPFADKTRTCMSIPWGDVSTGYYSTGIPNIVVYMRSDKRTVESLRLARPLLPLLGLMPVQKALKFAIERTVTGPSEEARQRGVTRLWGEVRNAAGDTVTGLLTTPDGYTLTAATALEAVIRIDGGADVRAGFRTPSMAFGAGFIAEFDGCELEVPADTR